MKHPLPSTGSCSSWGKVQGQRNNDGPLDVELVPDEGTTRMKFEKGYEGFLNYETWLMALWLNNDEGSQRYWKDAARDAWANSRELFEEPGPSSNYLGAATFDLAFRLQEEATEGMPDLGSTVYADLLNAALSDVDWSGVAGDFLEGLAV